MDISIVIATYKRPEILRKTLTAFLELERNGLTCEIFIVDNAAEERIQQLVGEFNDRLPCVYLKEPVKGKNRALNRGLNKTTGEIIIMADDDIIPQKDWLMESWHGAKRWPNHMLFGSRILPLWPGGKESPFSFLERNFFNAAYAIADWNIPEGEYDAGKVWGPSMMIKRKVLDQGFLFAEDIWSDKDNFLIGSETEFTKRLVRNGFPAVFLPKSLVYHQIREEQLTVPWICHRAFQHARVDTCDAEQKMSTQFFGAPRYLYKLLLKTYLKLMLSLDSHKKISLKVAAAGYKGQIYQFRIKNKRIRKRSKQ